MDPDTPGDLGRRHQREVVNGHQERPGLGEGAQYTIMQQLHRFMFAICRVSVDHDGLGGTAPGSRAKRRKVDVRVNVDLASLPEPSGF